uniref:Uncharacterized protein n=1 Tax=Anguilla anguilla TaxID=7936 RepID=A0A0E9PLY9_ANGAN
MPSNQKSESRGLEQWKSRLRG